MGDFRVEVINMKTDQVTNYLPAKLSKGNKSNDTAPPESDGPSVVDIARMHEADKRRLLEHLLTTEQLDYLSGKDLTSLRFYRREGSQVVFIDIIDRDTGDLIRTYPEPELMDIFSRLRQTGLLVNVNG